MKIQRYEIHGMGSCYISYETNIPKIGPSYIRFIFKINNTEINLDSYDHWHINSNLALNYVINYYNNDGSENDELLFYILYKLAHLEYPNLESTGLSAFTDLKFILSLKVLNIDKFTKDGDTLPNIIGNIKTLAGNKYGYDLLNDIDILCENLFKLIGMKNAWGDIVDESDRVMKNIYKYKNLTLEEQKYFKGIGGLYVGVLMNCKNVDNHEIYNLYPYLYHRH